jgi:hypothetical protein
VTSKRKSKVSRARKHRTRKTLRYLRLTERERAKYDQTTNLITDLRRGEGPFTELLKKHHLGSRTARKYGGRDLIGGTRGKPVRASKADRRVRLLMFPKAVGDVPIRTRNSRDATKLSEFFHDRDMLLRGKLRAYDFEAKWRGVHVAGRELFTDTNGIFQMADADELKIEHLYASTSRER